MKKIILALLLCLPLMMHGQTYWNKTFGGLSIDEALDISSDAAGNLYVTGYFSSVMDIGAFHLASSGVTDIFLAKFTAQGNVVWAVKAGGGGPDRAVSIKTDASGYSYITGSFHGTANFGGTSVTATGMEEDMFVAKYDPSGNLLWVRRGGGADADFGNAVTVDFSGNVIVTGQFKMTADFGPYSLSGMNDPLGQPSIDVFTAKYDASGNILWVKQGAAEFTDRGMAVACDDLGNIYVTGQFSDTIIFDMVHNNNMFNSIFLIKYSPAGQEQWFRRIGGGQYNIAYGLVADNNYLYMTGDFAGNMIFFGSPNAYLHNGDYQNIFIAKYDFAGNYQWSVADSSDCPVHVRDIATDFAGNTFVVGDFKCVFTQFAETYGLGTFNSVGFEDIFLAKYDQTGNRQWAQQFAGRSKDNGYGIVWANNDVFISGSFKKYINYPTTLNWQTGGYMSYAPSNYNYCSDINYNRFIYFLTEGEEDILVARPADLSRSPYDYYCRSVPGCSRDYIACCIDKYGSNECYCGDDTIEACYSAAIVAHTRTSGHVPNYYNCVGPKFHYQWSTGDTSRYITVYSQGTYSVTVTTWDSCFVSADTVYVILHPKPVRPHITDSKGVNFQSYYPQNIHLCYPDSVLLTAGDIGSNSFTWTGPLIPANYTDTSVWVHHGGYFSANVINTWGCTNSNIIHIIFYNTFDTVAPVMIFPGDTDHDDTITICQGDPVQILVYDDLSGNMNSFPGPVHWYINQLLYGYTSGTQTNFYPQTTGWYNVTALIIRMNICDTIIDTVSNDIYIIVHPNPVVNLAYSGSPYFCPGGSTTLVASGAQSYVWKLNGAVLSTTDTLIVNMPGNYQLIGTSVNAWGCSDVDYLWIHIEYNPAPVAAMSPPTGLICPNDSVYVYVNGPGQYEWYAPNGMPFAFTQGVWVNTPGNYYCVVTDPNNCIMATNTVEVVQYATPFLEAVPSDVICQGATVTINLHTNVGSIVQWLPPLYGNSLTQVVSAPGTYYCNVTSCGILTQTSVTISLSQPMAEIFVVGNDTICEGDTVLLSGNPGMVDYIWQPGGIHSQYIQAYQPGTYTLTITDAYGCTATDAIAITVMPYSGVMPVVSDTMICAGDSVMLTALPANADFYWYEVPGGSLVFYGNPFVTPVLTAAQSYLVASGLQGICPVQTAQVNVGVQSPEVDIIIRGNDTICEGDSVMLTGSPGMAAYLWSPSGEITPDVWAGSQGWWSLTVTDANGCHADTSVWITALVSSFSGVSVTDTLVCMGMSAVLTADPPNWNYIWYSVPGGAPDFVGNPYVTAALNTSQYFYVQPFDAYCTGEFIPVHITVMDCGKMSAANVFTPNGDGYNDVFRIDVFDVSYFSCTIYNRYGKAVYSWTDPYGYWDGTVRTGGTEASAGVYYFVATMKRAGDNVKSISGFVELLR